MVMVAAVVRVAGAVVAELAEEVMLVLVIMELVLMIVLVCVGPIHV